MLSIPNTHSGKLLRLYKRAREPKLIMAYHLLYLNSKGHKVSELAELFVLNEETVRTCIKKYLGHQELADADRSGRPRRLSRKIVEELCRIVDENNPEKHGYQLASWDCKELRIWLLNKYNVNASIDTIRRILRENSFRYVKANYEFINQKHSERKEFLKQLQKAVKTADHVFFEDEIKTKLVPRKGYVWTRKKKAFVPHNNSQQKAYTVSATNPWKAKTVTITDEMFNTEVFHSFLKKLVKHNRGRIVLVLDNHRAHHARKLKLFLTKHERLKLLFLPAYSPDLNPQEQVWKHLRQKLLNNKLYPNINSLCASIHDFLANLPKKELKKITNPAYLLNPS